MNLKYRIIFFLFATTYSVSSLGQIKLGGKIGYSHTNTAKVIGGRGYDGLIYGLTSSFPIYKSLRVNSDVLLEGRGYVIDKGIYDTANLTYKDCKVTFKYIDIPVLLETDVNNFLSIEFGPYIGMQVGRNLFYDNEKQDKDLLGKKQFFDMGFLAGIKGEYKGVFLEILYQYGLSQAFKDVNDFKTKGVCINLGYMFNLKK